MPKPRKIATLDPAERDRQILAALDLRSEFAALGVVFAKDFPNAAGWLDCYALGRDDRTPSAGCNIRTGRYHDFGGGENVSFWEFAAAHGNFADWRAAREHYAEKVGIGPAAVAVSKNGVSCSPRAKTPEKPARGYGDQKPTATPTNGQPDRPTRNPLDQLDFLDWTPAYERLATLWTIRHKRGITLEAIKAAGGRIARYKTKTTAYTVIALPVYGPDLLSADPISWIGYNITGGPLPVFKKINGKWKIEWLKKPKSFAPIGGGVIGRHGLERIVAHQKSPADNPIDVAWKTEGPSDLLALFSSIPPELRDRNPVITNAGGASETVQHHIACLFTGLSAAIVHDADSTGELGAEKWLRALAGFASDVRHVRLPYEVQPKHGKDLRDYLLEGSRDESNLNELQGLSVPQPA